MKHIAILSSCILLLVSFNGCKSTRHVQEGEHLLYKSILHLNENAVYDYQADEDELSNSIQQKPNRRVLGILPFHLAVWNFAKSRNSEKKLNEYLRTQVGEAPVLFEPILLQKSRDQLKAALRNNGYFDARVEALAYTSEDRVDQHFYVYTGEPYTMRRLSYAFEDTALIKEFSTGVTASLVRGMRYDIKRLDQERNRLTETMKNRGYFTFDKIHVVFDVDTNIDGNYFDVSVRLRNLRYSVTENGHDTILENSHRKHYIDQIIINENFGGRSSVSNYDSVFHRRKLYLFLGKPYVRPVRISRNIFIEPGEQYSLHKTQYTYSRISALNNFRFIDMKYETSETDSDQALLDLRINLTKAPRQSMTFETVGTNQSGNLGVSASLNYSNRNLFRGAEQFDWKVYGGLEWQNTNSTAASQNAEVIQKIRFINAYEFGAYMGITIPDFFGRIATQELPWFKEPKTTISVSADRQKRPLYQRDLLNTSYQYTIRLRPKDQLIFAPIDLSVIRLDKNDDFEKQLQSTNNSLLINSYNNHLIPAGKISYSYSSQQINRLKNFYYYRMNFESAGNLFRALSKPVGLKYNSSRNSYLIDSVAFAHYLKFDGDIAKYVNLTRDSRVVYRAFGGIGVPLSNLNTLPFERSFFAGGSNDIRAWRARALGPGSLADTATYGIDQVGELQFELNMEYRWNIIKQIEGALFMDVGNIWLLRYDPQRPGAEFQFNRFYNELAIAPGAGIRLNFNFLIFSLY